MASNAKPGRGRPVMHKLTPSQERAVIKRIEKGESTNQIVAALKGVHQYAVVRVRRGLKG